MLKSEARAALDAAPVSFRWFSEPFRVKPEPRAAFALSAILWAGVVVLVSMTTISAGYVRSPGEYATLILGTVSGVAIAGLLYVAFRELAGRPAWLAAILLIGTVVAAGFLQMLADYGGQFLVHALTDDMVMPDASRTAMVKVALVYVSIYATNAALFWVTFASRRLREQQLELAERTSAALRAELRILRLQLSPHFLFNALSVLSTLILAGRNEEAERMTLRLSDFLRASMDVDAIESVRLGDELSILDSYLAVEQIRFADRLRLIVDCPPETESGMVPNFILQPLVENAVKYAVQPSTSLVTVEIRARREDGELVLEVRDSGASFAEASRPEPGHGVGLKAVRGRLALCYGQAGRLEAAPTDEGFRAVMRMPFTAAQEPAVTEF